MNGDASGLCFGIEQGALEAQGAGVDGLDPPPNRLPRHRRDTMNRAERRMGRVTRRSVTTDAPS
jgi:hypothetical protein